MPNKVVTGILKGVLAMALADGELQPAERELLATLQERFGLEEGELAQAIGDARAFSPEVMRRKLPKEDRVTVAQYAAMAAYADGSVHQKEASFLKSLGERLGLEVEDVRRLEGLCRELAAASKKRPVDVGRLAEIVEAYL